MAGTREAFEAGAPSRGPPGREELADRVVARIQHSWETGEPWEDLFPLRGADGRYRWFLSRAAPIRDADGHVVRWFGTTLAAQLRGELTASSADPGARFTLVLEAG
jgi:PAS domain-containing protein